MRARAVPYLLDTNILVHYVRDDALSHWVEATYSLSSQPTSLLISIVTEGEIESLALQFGWGAQRRQRLRDLLGRLVSVPLTLTGIIGAYARIDAHRLKTGVAMGQNDLWIAATAHVTGARLITTDKDFDPLDPIFLTRDWIDPSNRP